MRTQGTVVSTTQKKQWTVHENPSEKDTLTEPGQVESSNGIEQPIAETRTDDVCTTNCAEIAICTDASWMAEHVKDKAAKAETMKNAEATTDNSLGRGSMRHITQAPRVRTSASSPS